MMNTKKTSQILPALFAVICAAFAGYFILIGSGMFTELTVDLILLATITILLLSSSKKSFYFILLPLALLHAFYTPTGLNFGPPSYQYIASLFATDILETKEFLLQIPVSSYLIAFAIPILIFLQYKSAVEFGIKFYRNKTFIALATLLFAYNMPLAEPIKETVSSTLKIVDEVQKLKQMSQSDSWGKSTLENSRYDDYVIVLGESARKDYHNAYGYPIENTPFMSNAKGTLIDGFRSAGTNTVASLRLMLTFPDKEKWEPNYSLSLVDLIKSAGIKTYWLSNQGTVGEYDTPIAKIAALSNHYDFTKTGDYSSINYFDTVLLPTFEKRLMEKTSKNRLFIIHIMGSHEYFEDRLSNAIHYNYYNRIISAYLQTIEQTDDFLKQIYEKLQQQGEPFSMIYFSDHGLATKERESKNAWLVHGTSKEAFEIPFVQINSDDTQHKMLKVQKSGFHFLSGYAHWLGIRENSLNPEYHFLSDKNDTIEIFNQYENVPFNSLPEDPILTDEKIR